MLEKYIEEYNNNLGNSDYKYYLVAALLVILHASKEATFT